MSKFFNTVKKQANKAATKVGEESTKVIEIIKINSYINNIENDAVALKCELGNIYYEMWVKEEIDFDEIDKLCQEIFDKYDIIKLQNEKLKKIKQEEDIKQDSKEVKYCTNCGAENKITSKFCSECGVELNNA